jgi:hypothetical protein
VLDNNLVGNDVVESAYHFDDTESNSIFGAVTGTVEELDVLD